MELLDREALLDREIIVPQDPEKALYSLSRKKLYEIIKGVPIDDVVQAFEHPRTQDQIALRVLLNPLLPDLASNESLPTEPKEEIEYDYYRTEKLQTTVRVQKALSKQLTDSPVHRVVKQCYEDLNGAREKAKDAKSIEVLQEEILKIVQRFGWSNAQWGSEYNVKDEYVWEQGVVVNKPNDENIKYFQKNEIDLPEDKEEVEPLIYLHDDPRSSEHQERVLITCGFLRWCASTVMAHHVYSVKVHDLPIEESLDVFHTDT